MQETEAASEEFTLEIPLLLSQDPPVKAWNWSRCLACIRKNRQKPVTARASQAWQSSPSYDMSVIGGIKSRLSWKHCKLRGMKDLSLRLGWIWVTANTQNKFQIFGGFWIQKPVSIATNKILVVLKQLGPAPMLLCKLQLPVRPWTAKACRRSCQNPKRGKASLELFAICCNLVTAASSTNGHVI